jgi:hypothetical protein
MSVENFFPTIWDARILSVLQTDLVATSPLITNRNYEGTIRGGGDRVKILQIGKTNIGTYTRGTDITFQKADSSSQFMYIDQTPYFALTMDDVDMVQANPKFMAAYANDAAYQMNTEVDKDVLGLHASAGITSGLGTTATPLTVTSADTSGSNVGIIQLIAQIKRLLTKNNVPEQGRYLILSPELVELLSIRLLSVVSIREQQGAATNGFVTYFSGFNIFQSNNLSDVGTASTPKQKILAGNNTAITLAYQLTETKAGEHEKQFGEYVKGLLAYGRKVVRPEALACATVTPTYS